MQETTTENGDSGPGAHPVSVLGIAIVVSYLTVFAALLLYLLVALWPTPTPSGEEPPGESNEQSTESGNTPPATTHQETTAPGITAQVATTPGTQPQSPTKEPATKSAKKQSSPIAEEQEKMEPVYLFGWRWDIADEVRLLMLVIVAGALGSLVHGLRSIYWYVGNRKLVWSWIPKYLLLPLSGAVLAVVFYFVVRGGFFSPRAGFQQTSPFGFAALAAMVGMFSEQAVLKLKEISETLLSKPAQGKNAEPQGDYTKRGRNE